VEEEGENRKLGENKKSEDKGGRRRRGTGKTRRKQE